MAAIQPADGRAERATWTCGALRAATHPRAVGASPRRRRGAARRGRLRRIHHRGALRASAGAASALYARTDTKDALFLAVYEHGMRRLAPASASFNDPVRWEHGDQTSAGGSITPLGAL